jgi:hypothetical protein
MTTANHCQETGILSTVDGLLIIDRAQQRSVMVGASTWPSVSAHEGSFTPTATRMAP